MMHHCHLCYLVSPCGMRLCASPATLRESVNLAQSSIVFVLIMAFRRFLLEYLHANGSPVLNVTDLALSRLQSTWFIQCFWLGQTGNVFICIYMSTYFVMKSVTNRALLLNPWIWPNPSTDSKQKFSSACSDQLFVALFAVTIFLNLPVGTKTTTARWSNFLKYGRPDGSIAVIECTVLKMVY